MDRNIWRFSEDTVTSSGNIIDCTALLFNLLLPSLLSQLRWLTCIHPPPLGSTSVKDEWGLPCGVVENSILQNHWFSCITENNAIKLQLLMEFLTTSDPTISGLYVELYCFFCCLLCMVIVMHWIGINVFFCFPPHTKSFKYNCEASDVSLVKFEIPTLDHSPAC